MDYPQVCPIFKDKLPFKAVTVVCDREQEQEVVYWLEYVQGGNCVTQRSGLRNGKVAIRAEYQCW